jgi:FHA domain
LEVVRRGKQLSCLLTDLGSQHGTWHNGSRLAPFTDVRLRVNDTVELGTAPGSRQGGQAAGGSSDADGQAAAGGRHQHRRAVIAVSGADMQPPLRATAAALRQLPRIEVSDTRPCTTPSALY